MFESVLESEQRRVKFKNKVYKTLSETILAQTQHGLTETDVKSMISEEVKLD